MERDRYQKFPSQLNVDVLQTCGVYDFVDIVRVATKNDSSSIATSPKGGKDCWGIIAAL
jgi:hypothetical protein